MIVVFASLSSIGVYLRVFSLTYFGWHGNKLMHEDMLKRVF
jgi:hypothetical protein